MNKALITGITGQDGFYLAKFLLEKDYEVHGLIRRSSTFNTTRIDPLISKYSKSKKLILHYSDLLDANSLNNLITSIKPDEIYNLAAQSHVAVSFKNPLYSTQTSTVGPLTLLEAVKNLDKDTKYYQASSSEMYGGESTKPLDENSPFNPLSPYAAGKLFAHNLTKLYRESYNLFAVNGILFNHESPLRGETFVTRKISRAVARISLNLQSKLTLGNLSASRDWGFAGDYVRGMWLMLQHDQPEDWVLATGKTFTVEQFASKAFQYVDLDFKKYIDVSEDYFRPNEVHHLLGNPSKAKKILNWEPEVSFEGLVEMMVRSDIDLAKQEKILLENNLISPTWENPV
tara:strand:- start:117 stop:1148 length:1032 start_codon:yes stop_codon:yes gene_type:complete